MSDMNVRQIVHAYLVANGYEGLYAPWGFCSCRLTELLPCSNAVEDCLPGYKGPCDCGEGCDWHIVEEKPHE